MYKCFDCGAVFDEPKHYSEDRTPGGVFEGGSFIEHFTGCPYCGGFYDTAVQCDGCNEWVFLRYITSTEDGKFCEMCIEEGDLDE